MTRSIPWRLVYLAVLQFFELLERLRDIVR